MKPNFNGVVDTGRNQEPAPVGALIGQSKTGHNFSKWPTMEWRLEDDEKQNLQIAGFAR